MKKGAKGPQHCTGCITETELTQAVSGPQESSDTCSGKTPEPKAFRNQ